MENLLTSIDAANRELGLIIYEQQGILDEMLRDWLRFMLNKIIEVQAIFSLSPEDRVKKLDTLRLHGFNFLSVILAKTKTLVSEVVFEIKNKKIEILYYQYLRIRHFDKIIQLSAIEDSVIFNAKENAFLRP